MLKTRHGNSVVCGAALPALLALSAAALSSCLLNVYRFAVVNKSRSPVEVQYTFKDKGKELTRHFGDLGRGVFALTYADWKEE